MYYTSTRWQDVANVIVAVWLFASPWAIGYSHELAAWNAWILGGTLFTFSAFALNMPVLTDELVYMLLSIWLILSPFALHFARERLVAINIVVVGILLIGSVILTLYRKRSAQN